MSNRFLMPIPGWPERQFRQHWRLLPRLCDRHHSADANGNAVQKIAKNDSPFLEQSADGGEDMSRIEEMIRELPSELQQEVLDFVEFLIEKRGRKRGGKLRQDWAGALSDYRDQYTSLELQKRALEWRGD